MKIYTLAMLLCSGLLLSACAGPTAEDYAANKPALDIRDFTKGDVEAWGMFFDNAGKADPTFHANLHGAWQGNTGTLKEHFDYSDGRKQDRMWTFTFTDDHHFTGTAPDVVGIAAGEQYGNAIHMDYVLTIVDKDGASHDMTMNDWIYRMDDKTVINRNEVSKFGIKVGELVITFRKK